MLMSASGRAQKCAWADPQSDIPAPAQHAIFDLITQDEN